MTGRARWVPEPGIVEARLSGGAEDVAAVISVLERLGAALPVTTAGVEVLHRSSAYPNRRDPGERVYLTVRVASMAGFAGQEKSK